MKALQNFLVRTQAYLAKEPSRQLELFQKRMQQQHAHQQHTGINPRINIISRQRQLLMQLRPFQRFLSFTAMTHHFRNAFLLHVINEEALKIQKAYQEGLLQSTIEENVENRLEGILDVLNDPPHGSKEFCGKYIDLPFQHVAETKFQAVVSKDLDSESVVQSQYYEDDYAYFGAEAMEPAVNVERIRNGEHFLDLTIIRSEYEELAY